MPGGQNQMDAKKKGTNIPNEAKKKKIRTDEEDKNEKKNKNRNN
jgi:hypothetical protein